MNFKLIVNESCVIMGLSSANLFEREFFFAAPQSITETLKANKATLAGSSVAASRYDWMGTTLVNVAFFVGLGQMMGWTKAVDYKGLTFFVDDGLWSGPSVRFRPDDKQTAKAIKSRDYRIFEILDWSLTDDFDTFVKAQWINSSGWLESTVYEENKERKYTEAINNPYVSEAVRSATKAELLRIKNKAHKKRLAKLRRKEFNKVREQQMFALTERDGSACNLCDATDDLTIDHIKPLSKGGSDSLDNLQILCRSCNSTKGDR